MIPTRQRYVLAIGFLCALGVAVWFWTLQLQGQPAAQPLPAPVTSGAGECNGAVLPQPPQIDDPAASGRAQKFCHSFYEVAYSTQFRDPLWSAEHLTRAMAEASDGFGRTKTGFGQQDGLDAASQGANGDYTGSGYDRGHMTPANDAGDEASEADTFVMTNVVPQTKVLNERLWQYLEASVHQVAERDGEVYVVTGPIFFGNPQWVSDRVAIPAYTYKAIYVPSTGLAAGFIATNEPQPACVMVSLAVLHQRSGVDPFPGLADGVKNNRPDIELPHGVHVQKNGRRTRVPLPDCLAQ